MKSCQVKIKHFFRTSNLQAVFWEFGAEKNVQNVGKPLLRMKNVDFWEFTVKFRKNDALCGIFVEIKNNYLETLKFHNNYDQFKNGFTEQKKLYLMTS